ncbi:3-oxoacyl-ACP reductase [Curtobacterium sp. MCBD17_013]|uniref:SDR family NAD(P)-dependent oxidoreductase n=1 Tax=Curtobacterium sp. MCBD17_013 TaxID=2175668 RepID=UPI000DA7B53A|nr:SDR family NAD(P)-dependent oxidoreductase [Curtobacterium sp. MCBD17_013]PZF63300.1 3-oxoacyl-ACP reductase [Curtobacterium sp. MCBD17_013]
MADDERPTSEPSREGRVALVTGVTGGIGRAVTRGLLDAGYAVVGTVRDRSRASTAELDPGRTGRLVLVEADMTDTERLHAVAEAAADPFGPVDVLLPIAGVGDVRALDEITPEDWERALRVNLTAPFVLAQALLPGMVERGWGRIVFTSSVAAFTGGFVGPHYAASKAGLHGLVHALSARAAAHGVTVNAIAPALIADTAMIDGMPSSVPTPPVGRLGRPDEVAQLTLAVLGNAYLTGQVLLLEGGSRPS